MRVIDAGVEESQQESILNNGHESVHVMGNSFPGLSSKNDLLPVQPKSMWTHRQSSGSLGTTAAMWPQSPHFSRFYISR